MAFTAGQKIRASDLNSLLAHVTRYETNAATNCANITDTDIPFTTAITTDTAYFTVSGANFNCVKAGWVEAATSLRMAAGTVNIELKIKLNGSLVASGFNAGVISTCATGFAVAAGDIIKVSLYHATGSAKTLETGAGRQNHIALKWSPL